ALAVGGLFAMFFEFFRLPGREWQADGADPLDFQPGQHHGDTAGDTEGARAVDSLQGPAEFLQHGTTPGAGDSYSRVEATSRYGPVGVMVNSWPTMALLQPAKCCSFLRIISRTMARMPARISGGTACTISW